MRIGEASKVGRPLRLNRLFGRKARDRRAAAISSLGIEGSFRAAVDGRSVGCYLFTRFRGDRSATAHRTLLRASSVIERSVGIRIRDPASRAKGSRPGATPPREQGRLVTNSLFAARRVRIVSLVLGGLLLAYPALGIAQDPPKQDPPKQDPPKGGQENPKGEPKGGQDTDKQKATAEEALKKVKEQARKDAGEAPVKSVEMEKSGVARKKVEDIRNDQRVPMPQPARADIAAVTSGKGDKAQVRKWARYQCSQFTDPAQDKFVQKNHEEVLRIFKQQGVDEDYAKLLKTEFYAAIDELVNKTDEPKVSTVAKVNLITLIDELHHEDLARETHGVLVLLNTLENYEKHGDAVLYVTMNAIMNAKLLADALKRNVINVALERRAAQLLMKIARRGELQPLLLETLCKALGVIGMPFEGLVNEAVEVATFLANIATNETLAERTRAEAAIALGRLQKQALVMNYDYGVEAWVFAKAYQGYVNWVIENKKAEVPKVGPNVMRSLGARLYDAIRRSSEQASGTPGQEKLRSLLSAIQPSLTDILDNKDQPPDPEPINEWLKANTVQPLRLARRAQEIRPVTKPAAAAEQPAGGTAAANR